jgi:hypothetical protein
MCIKKITAFDLVQSQSVLTFLLLLLFFELKLTKILKK